MKTVTTTMKRLWKDESGQGATEYILLLVIVVALALLFKNQIKGVVSAKLEELGGAIGAFGAGEMQ